MKEPFASTLKLLLGREPTPDDSLRFGMTLGDSVRWDEVVEIVAFKVDQFSFDSVCLTFRHATAPEFVFASENDPGWLLTEIELTKRFPEVNPRWFADVASDPFQRNHQVLWRKEPGAAA